jgi:hypothetical protein
MVGLCLKGVNSLPAYEIGAKEGLNRIGERWGAITVSTGWLLRLKSTFGFSTAGCGRVGGRIDSERLTGGRAKALEPF